MEFKKFFKNNKAYKVVSKRVKFVKGEPEPAGPEPLGFNVEVTLTTEGAFYEWGADSAYSGSLTGRTMTEIRFEISFSDASEGDLISIYVREDGEPVRYEYIMTY